MAFLTDQWMKHFRRAPESAPPPELASLLSAGVPDDDEALVPDPEWEGTELVRPGNWRRPVLFMVAGALVITGTGYTLANDWWVAKQQRSLDRQLDRTAAGMQVRAIAQTTQIRDGLDALLARQEPDKKVPILPVSALPPTPPKLVTHILPVLRRLPPLLPMVPPPPRPTVPILPIQAVRSPLPAPKVRLIGGNERIVLLDVEGERLQLAPGQTGSREITVLAVRSTPERYNVQVRLGDGKLLDLSLAFGGGTMTAARPDPVAPLQSTGVTPLY